MPHITYMYTHLHKFHKNYLCFSAFFDLWVLCVQIVYVTSVVSNVITLGGGEHLLGILKGLKTAP